MGAIGRTRAAKHGDAHSRPSGGDMNKLSSVCLVLIGLAGAFVPAAQSAWAPDGVALSPNSSNYKPSIVSDGITGSIVAWYGGAGSDIVARRLLIDGSVAPGWPVTLPLVVSSAPGLQERPVLVADGTGGALVFWQDARNGSNYDIYAQHITSAGLIFTTPDANWVTDGIGISTAPGNEYSPMAVSDGAGGAIVVWQDGRQGAGNYDIYAQRVDGNGNLLWAPGGVPICAAVNNQINQVIIPDGAGGAYIAWQDFRKGTEYDIYMQRINGNGAIVGGGRWITNGLGVCLSPNSQFTPQLSQDGAGGVYIGWQDFRTGTDNHIFAQHLTSGGALIAGWPDNGSPVCQAQYSQYYPVLASDGGTNVFIAWQDYRDGTTNHIFAQKLTSDNRGWVADGLQVTNASNGQFSPQVTPDKQGGAFVTWYDSRGGSTNDIFVQQLNAAGVKNTAWDANGLAVCTAPNTQQFPVIATVGTGTSVMTWQDLRAGDVTTSAIFAQSAGTLASTGVGDDEQPIKTVQLSMAMPNPFKNNSQLRLTLPASASVQAEILDISGRRVTTLANGKLPAGVHNLLWNGTNARGESVAAGVYLVRVQTPGFNQVQRIVRLK